VAVIDMAIIGMTVVAAAMAGVAVPTLYSM